VRPTDRRPPYTSSYRIKVSLARGRRAGTPRRTPSSSSTSSAMAASMASTSLSARQGYAPARVAARAGAKPMSAARTPLRVVAGESRIGKHPVQVPKGVTYTLKDNHLAVKVRARSLLYIDSNNQRRRVALPRSRRRGPPAPVPPVHPATDRVLGFWLCTFSDPPSKLCLRCSFHRVPRVRWILSSPKSWS